MKKTLVMSSNYFVITLLHECHHSCWCALTLTRENHRFQSARCMVGGHLFQTMPICKPGTELNWLET